MSTGPRSERKYCVRCVFRLRGLEDGKDRVYEERATIWHADSSEAAIKLAKAEAREYAERVGAKRLKYAQALRCDVEPGHGSVVYSLVRTSRLKSAKYLETYFDTDDERQGAQPPHGGLADSVR